ncbi:hypothetical protein CLOM_g13787 [Closterium sp. NIES-68]|nr:hypothetical protein CLOM_g13787 [Closterium sp. NIES-68]
MKRRRGDASEGGEVVAAMDGSTCHVARVTPGGHTRVRMPSETSQRPRDCRSDSDEKRRGEERREEEWREEKWREEEWREEEWREEEWRAQFAHRAGVLLSATQHASGCAGGVPRAVRAIARQPERASAARHVALACGLLLLGPPLRPTRLLLPASRSHCPALALAFAPARIWYTWC